MLSHHWTWVLNAALDHFVEQRDGIELELFRWSATKASRRIVKLGLEKQRDEEVERLRQRLIEFNNLIEEVVKLKAEHGERDSMRSAQGISEFIKSRTSETSPTTKKRAKKP
jgi:hypothetical protein